MSQHLLSSPQQQRRAVAVALTMIIIAGTVVVWLNSDPWPARVVITPPEQASGSQGFSTDGRAFLTAGSDGAYAWDLTTGKARQLARGRETFEIVLARDGQHYAGQYGPGLADREIVWVDTASGEIERRWPIPGRIVINLGLTQDDSAIRAILSPTDRFCEEVIWDLATGTDQRRRLAMPATGFSTMIACSPDGQRIAHFTQSPADNVWLWDVTADQLAGTLIRTGQPPPIRTGGHLLTPNGRTLILSRVDNQAEVWDLATRRLTRLVTLQPGPLVGQELRIAPDGQTLLSFTNFVIADPSQIPWWVKLLGNLSLGRPPMMGAVTIIDFASGRTLAISRTSGRAEFTPDGQAVVTHEFNGSFAVRPIPPVDR